MASLPELASAQAVQQFLQTNVDAVVTFSAHWWYVYYICSVVIGWVVIDFE
jgi:uncharacterized membrane protein